MQKSAHVWEIIIDQALSVGLLVAEGRGRKKMRLGEGMGNTRALLPD